MIQPIALLLSIAIILTGTLSLVTASCSAVDRVAYGWQGMAEQTGQMARTRLSREGNQINDGANVQVTLKNTGQTPLTDFSRWDVIVQYYGKKVGPTKPYFIKRLAFTAGNPGNDEWTVEGIFEDAQTNKVEVFEPGILNPAEEMTIRLKLNPKIENQTTNWGIITTSNGITVPVTLIR